MTQTRLRAGALAAIVAAAGSLAPGATPARTLSHGWIAFERPGGVAVVGVNGGAPRTLVAEAGVPAWSPDGREIAVEVSAASGSTFTLEVASPEGAIVRTLARGVAFDSPSWSRRGEIAFERAAAGRSYPTDVWVVGAGGGGLRRLLANAGGPAWSPDGKEIAFVRTLRDGSGALEIADADGTHARTVLRGYPANPAWSPDGKTIAYETTDAVRRGSSGYVVPQIAVVGVDGSGRRQLTALHGLQGNMEPAWSPDGTEIAFARDRCFPEYLCPRAEQVSVDLWVMRADGSHQRRLVVGGAWPDWRPR